MRIKILTILFVVLSLQFAGANTSIVFRVDDFMFRDNARQEQIVNTFEKYDIPLSVAWIPFDWETKKADTMSDSLWTVYAERINSGKIDIMQHGCYHRNFKPVIDPYREFINQTLDEQRALISRGKQTLDSCLLAHGVDKSKLPETFVFPCNDYKRDAIEIVSDAGFTTISANIARPIDNTVLFYPCTTEDFYELEKAADNLKDGIIIVLFHDFTFDGDFTFERLEKLLSKLKQNSDVEFITIRDLIKRESPSYNGAFVGKAPVYKRIFNDEHIYLNGLSNFVTSFAHALFYALAFWFSYMAGAIIFKQRRQTLKATLLATVPFVAFGVQAYLCIAIHIKAFLLLVALAGFIIPTYKHFRERKSKKTVGQIGRRCQ